jgi:hypothetical protein
MYKDKNGKEIKVGDRISITGIVEVAAEPGMAGFLTARLDNSEFPTDTATTPLLASQVEVISELPNRMVHP